MKQLLKCLAAALALIAFSFTASAEPDDQSPLHLFLFIGGINMEGRGHVKERDIEACGDALMWDSRAKSWVEARPPFSRMSPHSFIRKHDAHRHLGLGPSFVQEYTKANPGVRVGIINASRNVMDVRDWQRRYIKTAIGITKQALASQPEGAGKAVLKGVLWHGGGEATQEGHLERYPKVLAEMIENLRKELAGGKSLPVVFGQLETESDHAKLYYVPFNKMIVKQADVIPLTACVTTEGLEGHGIFFYSQGYRDLGERYAKAMIGLLDEEGLKISAITRVKPGTKIKDIKSDAFDMSEVTVDNRVLKIKVSYSGAARNNHDFTLYSTGDVQTSSPPQVHLYLKHDAKGDRAEAVVMKTLEFDLEDMNKPAIIHVHTDHGEKATVTYGKP